MNLWEIQPAILSLLQASPSLNGVPVIADDGSYPKTPEREQALRTKGLVIIVWQIESGGLADLDHRLGFATHDVEVHVVIEENITINRAAGGSGIQAEKALQFVFQSLIGKKETGALFVPDDPPFKNFGKVNGINQWVANLRARLGLSPNASP